MAIPNPVEAEIVRKIPYHIAATLGRITVCYSLIEHRLSSLAALILQINKAEMRIALRMPRAVDRLDIVLDLFAVKAIPISEDTYELRIQLTKVCSRRDNLAHGLWLKHPDTGVLHLRLTRGQWPKDITKGEKIARSVFPQSIPIDLAYCKETLTLCESVLKSVDKLGAEFDAALQSSPEKFREPSPLIDPLGRRKTKAHPGPPQS